MSIKKITLISSLIFANTAFAQYSTINPAAPVNSTAGISQKIIENTLYNLKPKLKSTTYLNFDDMRIKIYSRDNPEDISISYLTTNLSKSICNLNIFIKPDGRIFANPPAELSNHISLTPEEITTLNSVKLSALLAGCSLDNQQDPFGSSSQTAQFKRINQYYKNGQVFNNDITINQQKFQVQVPSLYLLYRNNYADLSGMAVTVKNAENKQLKNVFGKYQTINKIVAFNLRKKKGIPTWESFNSFDIALKDNFFNNLELNEKDLENKIKNISYESVFATYVLGERDQTEGIMDLKSIKQAALVSAIQQLDKSYDFRTSESNFNKLQSPVNNMALKLTRETVAYLKSPKGATAGYTSTSSKNTNYQIISAYLDYLLNNWKLNNIASTEYDNMLKHYSSSNKPSLSIVNSVGFSNSIDNNTVLNKINDEFKNY